MLLLWNAARNRKSGFFTVIHYLLQRVQLLRDFINNHIYSFRLGYSTRMILDKRFDYERHSHIMEAPTLCGSLSGNWNYHFNDCNVIEDFGVLVRKLI